MAGVTALGQSAGYAGLADVWAVDAVPVYRPMAAHLLAALPVDVAGRAVLDAGAGSGVAGDLLRARGAEVVSVDVEPDMVAHLASKGRALLGDVRRLPLPDGDVEVSVAAFVLNHLPDPWVGVAELARVTASGGWVLASVFGNDREPAKSVVDRVATSFGYTPPGWYVEQQRAAEQVGTAAGFAAAADTARLPVVLCDELRVDVGVRDPVDVVRYRCALPQLRSFVTGLDPARRQAFLVTAAAALAERDVSFRPTVVRLVGQPG